MSHPARDPKVQKDIGPQLVVRSFIDKCNPLSSFEFPALPATIPVFSSQTQASSASDSLTMSRRTQPRINVSAVGLKGKADPGFMAKVGGSISRDSTLFKVGQGTGVTEGQYWNAGLPWCVYGEQSDKDNTSRRYWLVDMGSD